MYFLTSFFSKSWEVDCVLFDNESWGSWLTYACHTFHTIFARFRRDGAWDAVWAWTRIETFHRSPRIRIVQRPGCACLSHAGQRDLSSWRWPGNRDRGTCVLQCEQKSCVFSKEWLGGKFDRIIGKDVLIQSRQSGPLSGGTVARSPRILWHCEGSRGMENGAFREHIVYVVSNWRLTWRLCSIESIGEVELRCAGNWCVRPIWTWKNRSWRRPRTDSLHRKKL